jgi:zinc transport system substrate-binding protein
MLCVSSPLRAEPIANDSVVATLAPVAGIVAALMEGVGKPTVLVPAAASEHGFYLKPSQRSLIENARIIILISRDYERFMDRALREAKPAQKIIEIATLPDVQIFPVRNTVSLEEEDSMIDNHDSLFARPRPEKKAHDHAHDHKAAFDGHLWLSPENAAAIARGVALQLSESYPDKKIVIAANRDKFLNRLEQSQNAWQQALNPYRQKQFIVFHDAYQYFEKSFGLQPSASLIESPEQGSSAKRLVALRKRIEEEKITCLFREPQYPSRLPKMLGEGLELREGVLDPLGSTLSVDSNHYFTLIDGLVNGFTDCFKPGI